MRKEQTTTNTMDMGDYTSTSSDTYQTTTTHYLKTCPHRLPCGYCRLLMQNCPKDNTIKVTY